MRATALALAAALAVVLAAVARGYFTANQTTAQTISAVPDFLPPSINSAVTWALGAPGIYPALGYQVFANVTDSGNPASGVKSVTADASQFGGPSNLALSAGSYPPGQSTYNYGSSSQIANILLIPGTVKSYSVTATDNLNQTTTSNYTVTVNSGCDPTSISAPNGGAFVRKMDAGDSILYGFSANVDQTSIVPSWTGGGSIPVTVKLTDNGTTDDTITILSGSTTTPLGSIDTNGNYTSSGTITFNGTMIESGNNIKVTIDSSPFNAATTSGATAMKWSPGSGITYNNGAPCSNSTVTQSSAVNNF